MYNKNEETYFFQSALKPQVDTSSYMYLPQRY